MMMAHFEPLLKNFPMKPTWQPWRFQGQSKAFWRKHENCKEFLDYLTIIEQLTTEDRWYSLKKEAIIRHGGKVMLLEHSMYDLLKNAYPSIAWKPWCFVGCSREIWQDTEIHREYFDWLADKLKIDYHSEWYNVLQSDIYSQKGRWLLVDHFDNSLFKALSHVYPGGNWKPWKFAYRSTESFLQHRFFLDFIMEACDAKKRHFVDHRALFNYYYTCIISIVNTLGDGRWKSSIFMRDPLQGVSFRKVCALINEKLGTGQVLSEYLHSSLLDAMRLQANLIVKVGVEARRFFGLCANPVRAFLHQIRNNKAKDGNFYARHFEEKLQERLQMIYPQLDWQFGHLFFAILEQYRDMGHLLRMLVNPATEVSYLQNSAMLKLPKGYWEDVSHRVQYFQWLGEQLRIRTPNDWYSVRKNDIIRKGGSYILGKFSSLQKALKEAFPQVKWQPWRFRVQDDGIWDDPSSHKEFFDWLRLEMQIVDVSGWYRVTRNDVCRRGGKKLLQHYRNSVYCALTELYPDAACQLRPWKFIDFREHLWNDFGIQKDILWWLESKMNVKAVHDWSGITSRHVNNVGGGKLLQQYGGSLIRLLQSHYNEDSIVSSCSWQLSSKGKSQKFLENVLKKLLPSVDIVCSPNGIPLFKYLGSTERTFHPDIWVPELNLALEYQGLQHYLDHGFVHNEDGLWNQCLKDEEKLLVCEHFGIKLVHIPFWWDWDVTKLAATLDYYVLRQ